MTWFMLALRVIEFYPIIQIQLRFQKTAQEND